MNSKRKNFQNIIIFKFTFRNAPFNWVSEWTLNFSMCFIKTKLHWTSKLEILKMNFKKGFIYLVNRYINFNHSYIQTQTQKQCRDTSSPDRNLRVVWNPCPWFQLRAQAVSASSSGVIQSVISAEEVSGTTDNGTGHRHGAQPRPGSSQLQHSQEHCRHSQTVHDGLLQTLQGRILCWWLMTYPQTLSVKESQTLQIFILMTILYFLQCNL